MAVNNCFNCFTSDTDLYVYGGAMSGNNMYCERCKSHHHAVEDCQPTSDCEECINFTPDDEVNFCSDSYCTRNPMLKDNFKPKKPEWFSRLFKGCPLILKSNGLDSGDELIFFTDFLDNETMIHTTVGYTHKEYIRLPTIEESPRNVWLLHDGSNKCPEGAEKLTIITWGLGDKYPDDEIWIHGIDLGDWDTVDKFMIIDKEAFK